MKSILQNFIFIFMFICIIILFIENKNIKNKINNNFEKFENGNKLVEHNTNTSTQDLNNKIKKMINEQYNYDVDAIRNLGAISKSLLTGKNYHNTTGVTSGDLKIPANVQTLGNHNVDGNINTKGTLLVGGFELLPAGSIIIWSKSNIPNGWVICDGNNNTPNLQGRFVLSSGQGSVAGMTNRTLNEAGPENGNGIEKGGEVHKLDVTQMPSHQHDTYGGYMGYSGGGAQGARFADRKIKFPYPSSAIGGGKSHNNMPPYYVLIYIMKVY